ncbi:MAG: hypothetical protein HQM08_08045 [Candidatus Riflebacteria bacterium]|nr:hypothetical protein [Candidatus Riflebacteria bacterium]
MIWFFVFTSLGMLLTMLFASMKKISDLGWKGRIASLIFGGIFLVFLHPKARRLLRV